MLKLIISDNLKTFNYNKLAFILKLKFFKAKVIKTDIRTR